MGLRFFIAAIAALLSLSCKRNMTETTSFERYRSASDIHSFSNPSQVRMTHVALDLTVSFAERTLAGTATLALNRSADRQAPLILDTRDLKIEKTEAADNGVNFSPVPFSLGKTDPILGTPLTIQLPPGANHVRITYRTSPNATALQWLKPEQTFGKKHPFLYTQSQAIHARSWIPLQDTPGVRVSYKARIRVPKDLVAVMSAKNEHAPVMDGDFSFEMPQAIPSYLIALAVGRLEFRGVSTRSGVYAEPEVVEKAWREFEDLEKMLQAAEQLYGVYRWEQYDVLILPPSFPFGGMENPRLTFVTPTLLAGDKSLVGVISHELAHSWSGNLVSNATWRDFWLNEGFTTYFENRIQEQVYGERRSQMESQLEVQSLREEMNDLPEPDEHLYIDLKGRDPDDGMTQVPYVKGMLMLRRLEQLYGRERFDIFLRGYFSNFAFRSITTADFAEYLQKNLLNQPRIQDGEFDLEAWLSRPGLPPDAPVPVSEALAQVKEKSEAFAAGRIPASAIPMPEWSAAERQFFLTSLPENIRSARMGELDKAFGLTQTGNAEVKFEWLRLAIRSGYSPAYPALERFLIEVGRRKYLKPLYTELAKTPEGLSRARAIYAKARPGYHSISASTIDGILKTAGQQNASVKQ